MDRNTVSIPSDRGFCNDVSEDATPITKEEFQSPLIGASVMTGGAACREGGKSSFNPL